MIEINNLTGKKIDEKFLKGLAKKVLKGENREETDLSIAFVDKKRIKELNKKYRKKDEATDVLSFGNGLNEIVICSEMIKSSLEEVLIHGLLHLLGNEHGEKMEEKQKYYLNLFKCLNVKMILWQNHTL
ncbi:MAG: rRNA maturation RNase YbeY [Candidatus Nealsonbacteria bacterium RBG_13_37_56]|uniref:Endoribonuclease YbeY n=1 Tax=Candidatus Nealsonbacteria bacterium RBG_13_37_56 TaxID=1801661 RepID=A0A1G2DZ06_9BACT|nr:MAG: rRNA maturation RNase YbeY [Candidatus Nealsonbacteria bacterium RBG_13_37_56]